VGTAGSTSGLVAGLLAAVAAEEAMAFRLSADAAALRYGCLRDRLLAVVRQDRRHARLPLEAAARRQGESPQPGGALRGAHDALPGPPFLRLQEDREAKLALAARYRALGHEAEMVGDREAAALCRGLAAEETRHAQVLLDLLAATDPYHN
jgi:hypothetical protein